MRRTAFSSERVAGLLFLMAQTVSGPPWLLPRTNASWPYLHKPESTSYAMDVSHFSNTNLTMGIMGGSTMSFKYEFQDFQGTNTVSSGQEALFETRCHKLESSHHHMNIPLKTTNFTEYPNHGFEYRWIFPLFNHQVHEFSSDGNGFILDRKGTIQVCTSGSSNFACFNNLSD